MLIGISGPACTGKTTLLEDLKPELERLCASGGIKLEIRTERIRHLYQQRYHDIYATLDDLLGADPLELDLALAEMFRAETDLRSGCGELIIYDRTALDVAAYTSLDKLRGFRNQGIEQRIDKALHGCLKRIDTTLMTWELPLETECDGFRSTAYLENKTRQQELDIFRMLGEAFHDTVWLPADRQARAAVAVEKIKTVIDCCVMPA